MHGAMSSYLCWWFLLYLHSSFPAQSLFGEASYEHLPLHYSSKVCDACHRPTLITLTTKLLTTSTPATWHSEKNLAVEASHKIGKSSLHP
jgi:hypothetical protein